MNSTLAGGVVIGAPVSLIYRPGVAIFIGFTTGMLSTVCFHSLTPKLLKWIGLYDTCGIHNLHGIPGLLGGIWSAIIVAFYNTGHDIRYDSKFADSTFLNLTTGYLRQGGLQIAGTFCSLFMAIGFGIIGGFLTRCFYTEKNKYFYLDTEYFEEANFGDIYRGQSGTNLYLDQKKIAQ